MSPSKPLTLTTLLASAVLVASCTGADPETSSGAPSTAPGATAPDVTGTLRMLPQLSQPGPEPADAADASAVMVASFEEADPGSDAVLQARDGDAWTEAGTATIDEDGEATFTAPFTVDGEVAKYRVVTGEGDDQQGTSAVAADAAGAPVLDDGFDGDAMPEHWTVRPQEPTGFRACSDSSPEASVVADGTLRLSVLDDPARGECRTEEGVFDWRLVGHVSTQGQKAYTYGYAAARIKLQPRRGQHGAFWLQKTQPEGSEIDVVEYFGDRPGGNGALSSFVHFTDENGESVKAGPDGVRPGGQFIDDLGQYGKGWSEQFHVFSVEWTPEEYIFRIDGKETFRTSKGVSDVPEFLILSLQANTYEIPFLDGNPKPPHRTDALPQHMYVDWVRYWER